MVLDGFLYKLIYEDGDYNGRHEGGQQGPSLAPSLTQGEEGDELNDRVVYEIDVVGDVVVTARPCGPAADHAQPDDDNRKDKWLDGQLITYESLKRGLEDDTDDDDGLFVFHHGVEEVVEEDAGVEIHQLTEKLTRENVVDFFFSGGVKEKEKRAVEGREEHYPQNDIKHLAGPFGEHPCYEWDREIEGPLYLHGP